MITLWLVAGFWIGYGIRDYLAEDERNDDE